MSNSLLTLGSFSFEGLESPGQILLKTKQRLIVHHLGSGSSLIDSLGKDTEVVSFHGIFAGAGAATRIRSIEYLRSLGTPIALTWNARTLAVIIQEFELSYVTNQWIPYKLSCYVVPPTSGRGDLSTEDLISPSLQVTDVIGILANTDMSITPVQSSALALLASLNFDEAPADAVQQLQGLLSSIGDELASLDQEAQQGTIEASLPPAAEAQALIELISSASLQSALLFAYSRLREISVGADTANQQ